MYAAYIHRTPAMIKANAQETHGDICQIALLQPTQAAAIWEAHASDNPPIPMHVRHRHGSRSLDVYRLTVTWTLNGAIAAELRMLRMQIKSARFTEEQLFSSRLSSADPCLQLLTPASRAGCSFRATRLLVHAAEEKPVHIASNP
jgi:hypothetical protein